MARGRNADTLSYVDGRPARRPTSVSNSCETQQDWLDQEGCQIDAVLRRGARCGDPGRATRPWARCGRSTTGRTARRGRPRFSANIRRHIELRGAGGPFNVSANTDRRVTGPSAAGPGRDMLLPWSRDRQRHRGRGAKYGDGRRVREPGVRQAGPSTNWGDAELPTTRSASSVRHEQRKGLKYLCRTGFAAGATRRTTPDAPRVDEGGPPGDSRRRGDPEEECVLPTPGRRVHPGGRCHVTTRCPFTQRNLRLDDLMIGAALWNVKTDRAGERNKRPCRRSAPSWPVPGGASTRPPAAIAMGKRSPGWP